METTDRIADAEWAGCGGEIASDAREHGYVPELVEQSGSGDQRLGLWRCGDCLAIATNGNTVWQDADPAGFAELLETLRQ